MKTLAILFLAALAYAAPQSRPSRAADPDQQEITNFRLTTDNLAKYSATTEAVLKMMQADPNLKKQFPENQKNKTIAQAAESMEKNYPAVASAIRGAGMTPHDYLVMTGALIGSTMTVGMKKQGVLKEIPPSISPENAAFVEQNFDKVTTLMQKMQAAN
jgi:hypothetical protein